MLELEYDEGVLCSEKASLSVTTHTQPSPSQFISGIHNKKKKNSWCACMRVNSEEKNTEQLDDGINYGQSDQGLDKNTTTLRAIMLLSDD